MLESSIRIADAIAVADRPTGPRNVIDDALDAVRQHLDMPIAYLSEFVGEETVFRNVCAPGLEAVIRPGDSRHLDEVYCRHILKGDLPQLMSDTSEIALARDLPITRAAPIGSHVSVPILRSDGSVFGMFCCLSPAPNPSLNDRDLKVMRLFAGLVAEQVRLRLDHDGDRDAAAGRTHDMLRMRAFDMAFQPIHRLACGRLASVEALCRFRSEPYRTPDLWFADARLSNLQTELELAAVERALLAVPHLPPGVRLSINASPDTVSSGALLAPFRAAGADRVTLEITEHDQSGAIVALTREVDALRTAGALIAIDDVGVGYSGLHQILRLRPDILKLDMSLVRDIDTDPARRALVTAMVQFGRETGAVSTAEGIETLAERDTLRALGVDHGQGWLLGKPAPLAETLAATGDGNAQA